MAAKAVATATAKAAATATANEVKGVTAPEKVKVSIVDDNNINCYVLKEMLSSNLSVESTTHTDSKKFLDSLMSKEINPDVIFTDILMPDVDGYDLTEKIKKKFPDIRIIGITALPKSREIISKVKRCGMENVIFKPYDTSMVVEYLKKCS